ncbi:unnamed protein product [Rotaria socialis]
MSDSKKAHEQVYSNERHRNDQQQDHHKSSLTHELVSTAADFAADLLPAVLPGPVKPTDTPPITLISLITICNCSASFDKTIVVFTTEFTFLHVATLSAIDEVPIISQRDIDEQSITVLIKLTFKVHC